MSKRKRVQIEHNYEFGDVDNQHDVAGMIIAAEGGNAIEKSDSNHGLPWMEDEDLKLIEAVDMFGWGNPLTVDWDKVSQHLNSDRTAEQCSRRWNAALKFKRTDLKAPPWSKEEDSRLEDAVRRYSGQGLRGGIEWDKVKQEVGDTRSVNQCRGRWNGILKHRTPAVRNTPWTKEEDDLLVEAVGLNDGHGRRGAINWTVVSQHLQGMRSSQQCSHRWNRVLRSTGIAASEQPWTNEEDDRLRDAAQEFYGQGLRGGVDWFKVAERMGSERSPQQYGHRWNRVVKYKGVVRRNNPWSPEEDERMIQLVAIYDGQGLRGAVDWARVSEGMGGERTSQQCCHRWVGVLRRRSEISRVATWSADEDARLTEAVHLYENQGLRGAVHWGRVSQYLNHERSEQQCSHRWNRVLSNRGHAGTNTAWTEEEDSRLREAVLMYEGQGLRGGVDWKRVSAALKDTRTQQQYCTRWNRVLKHGPLANKTVTWSDADDEKLLEAVHLFRGVGRGGSVDWMKVCEYVGNDRTREQYCGRWNGVLKQRESKLAARNAAAPASASASAGAGSVVPPVASSSALEDTSTPSVPTAILESTVAAMANGATEMYQI